MHTPTAHTESHAHTHSHTAPPASNQTTVGTRTANLTIETPILGTALLALVAGVLALPDVALLLLGIPAAVVVGVAALSTAARFLAR